MARLFFFSDIHGNMPALTAVYTHAVTAKELDESKGDRVIIPGDLVNYGGCPGAVIDFVRSAFKKPEFVIGNHEFYVQQVLAEREISNLGEKTEERISNSDVIAGAGRTLELLTDQQARFVKELTARECCLEDRYRVSHTVPDDLESYVFPNTNVEGILKEDPQSNFIVGHSHISTVFIHQQNGNVWTYNPDEEWDKQFGTDWRTTTDVTKISVGYEDAVNFLFVCPSVGKPRADDCLKSGYAIVDTDEKDISLYRVPYDHEQAAKDIEDNGMPPLFAEHIRLGR